MDSRTCIYCIYCELSSHILVWDTFLRIMSSYVNSVWMALLYCIHFFVVVWKQQQNLYWQVPIVPALHFLRCKTLAHPHVGKEMVLLALHSTHQLHHFSWWVDDYQIEGLDYDPLWKSVLDICFNKWLGSGFKHFLFSPLFGKKIQFDDHIFQMGWNHQPDDGWRCMDVWKHLTMYGLVYISATCGVVIFFLTHWDQGFLEQVRQRWMDSTLILR